MQNQYIIFFDAQCNLCSRFVNFVFKRDTEKLFLYAPLQGTTAKQHLKTEDIKSLKTIIVLKNNIMLKETEAVQTVMTGLYPRYSILFSLFPPRLFNVFYRFIAKNRYKILGKRDSVFQAPKDQKNYFLP